MCTTNSLPRSTWRYTLSAVLLTTLGCQQQMADQPRYDPLEASDFFQNGMASRQPPVGTVARGKVQLDDAFSTGLFEGKPISILPAEALQHRTMAELLQRGQERFDIYCAACHDRVGTGRGMVVERGFPAPPSFQSEHLLQAPLGHFFDVATQGFGRMPSYAGQTSIDDRWAIAAYIRALQLSQNANVVELPAEDQQRLNAAKGETP